MSRFFSRLATHATGALGHPLASVACLLLCAVMVAWGILSHFDALWGLILGSATGLLSLQLLTLLQNSQNRDSAALHAKLDLLIASGRGTPNDLIQAEDRELAEIRQVRDDAVNAVAEHDSTTL